MDPTRLHLRCFGRKDDDGTWFAMCLDLNLYARGDSVEEAQKKLHGAICDYVNDAFGDDAAYKGDLIPRRAPLSFWAEYYWLRVKLGAHAAAQNARAVLFNEDLPMRPVC